jgi:hypothetical protein
MKVVEAATAQAKKKKKRLDEQKELKARVLWNFWATP